MALYVVGIASVLNTVRFIRKQVKSLARLRARRELYRQIQKKGFPPVLWSKGYAFLAEQNGGLKEALGRTEKRWTLDQFLGLYDETASSYWIPLTSNAKNGRECPLDWFAKYIVPKIKNNFILITTDGPAWIPNDLSHQTVSAILESKKLRAWFSQNVVLPDYHPKLMGVPLGIDLHTDRGAGVGWGLFEKFLSVSRANENCNRHVIADCLLNLNSASRRNISSLIMNDKRFVTFLKPIDQLSLWEFYSRSRYVLSPEGVGADCHRTWEALYMGASVICKDVGMSQIYKDLPVYMVDSWDELSDPELFERIDEYVKDKHSIWEFSSPEQFVRKLYMTENFYDI